MLILLGILSVTFSLLIFVVGLVINIIGKVKKETENTDAGKVYGGGKRDPWQDLGLVYRTTNLIRASVVWDENEGDIKEIFANVEGKRYDAEKDEMVDLLRGVAAPTCCHARWLMFSHADRLMGIIGGGCVRARLDVGIRSVEHVLEGSRC